MSFEIPPGDDRRLLGSVINADRTPYDLTGAALRFYGPGFALDGVIASAPTGTYYFDLLGQYTQQLSRNGRYAFKVRITRSGGGVSTLIDDAFTTS